MSKTKGKIYVWCFRNELGSGAVNGSTRGGDVSGYGMAGDGKVLASHWSSSESFAKHDLGISSDWKHDKYKEHYPEGYELIWLGLEEELNIFSELPGLDVLSGFQEAYRLNQEEKKVLDAKEKGE